MNEAATPGFAALFWLLAILAAIPAVLWLMRRSPMLAQQNTPGAPRLVANMALSPSQRLVTVEVGQGEERQWLVLGVTGQQVSLVHSMAPSAAPPAQIAPSTPDSVSAKATAFSQLLARMSQAKTAAGQWPVLPGSGNAGSNLNTPPASKLGRLDELPKPKPHNGPERRRRPPDVGEPPKPAGDA